MCQVMERKRELHDYFSQRERGDDSNMSVGCRLKVEGGECEWNGRGFDKVSEQGVNKSVKSERVGE